MSSKIITFASQKGGVGKSTLCTLFANYLVDKGHEVIILDCDPQQSILKRRQYEMQTLKNFTPSYRVEASGLENAKNVERLMGNLRQIDRFALIDTPPGLGSDGRSILLQNSDWVIVPFQYELTTAISTNGFLKWVKKEPLLGSAFWKRMILVPNRIQIGAGNANERERGEQLREMLEKIVIISPQIDQRKDIERTKTVMLSSVQHRLLDEVFDFIYNKIISEDKIVVNED